MYLQVVHVILCFMLQRVNKDKFQSINTKRPHI